MTAGHPRRLEVRQQVQRGHLVVHDTVYFAWQDSRNATRETDAEDVYTAALALDGTTADAESGGGGVPSWLLVGSGVLLGMGLTMVLVWRLRAARS